ncbi:MAG: 1-acyl-sn-glycerol-3-phosphate acyltransferase [Campylobacterales bacterium]|nr:1-acyl-sn-glycerol-3-phosphate acyltransferase [Campylobacterales bacterium]
MLSRIKALFIVFQFSCTVAVVIVLMYSFKNHIHKIIKVWMQMQMKLLGIKLEIVGKCDDSCDMLLMNHRSVMDIVIIEYLHTRHLAWVGKKEIEDLFLFGHIMRAPEMITIDRQNKTGLMKLIKEAKDRVSKNRPIAMFPEGTRSKGDELLKFKSGAAIVANKLNLRVQPVVLINTKSIFDSQGLRAKAGIVKVIYLDPIQADRKTKWFEEMEEKMNTIYNKEVNSI